MDMALNDDLVSTVSTLCLDSQHVACVPPLVIKLGDLIFSRVYKIPGVHDIQIIGVDLNLGGPVLYLDSNPGHIGLCTGIIIELDIKAVVPESTFHNDHGQLILLEHPDEAPRDDRHKVQIVPRDIDQHVVVAAQLDRVVKGPHVRIAPAIHEDVFQAIALGSDVDCVPAVRHVEVEHCRDCVPVKWVVFGVDYPLFV